MFTCLSHFGGMAWVCAAAGLQAFRGSPQDCPVMSLYIRKQFYNVFCIPAGKQVPAQRAQSSADTIDGEPYDTDKNYAKAALYALQKHTDAITNISATQISPQLYSNCLISAETLSMISTNLCINKSQMLVVCHDLRCRVELSSARFVKFVDILRSYPEYEGLANDLQGLSLLQLWCKNLIWQGGAVYICML